MGASATLACDGDSHVIGTLLGNAGGSGGSSPAPASGGESGLAVGGGGQGGGTSCEPGEPTRHFDFAGAGTELVDRKGGPSGTLLGGATLDGSGQLVLDGVDDYVALAERPWTGDSLTVALWVEYRGEAAYQRLFDFGSNEVLDPVAGSIGTSYLALTPATGYFPAGLAVLLSASGSASEVAAVSDVILTTSAELVVVTVDNQYLQLFHSGRLVTRVPHDIVLSTLAAQNNWLGRSEYAQDPYALATYSDLTFYERTLSDCEVAALYARGAP